jgi:hypothetical protein
MIGDAIGQPDWHLVLPRSAAHPSRSASNRTGRRAGFLLLVLVECTLLAGCTPVPAARGDSEQELIWLCQRTGGRWIDDGFTRGCTSPRG